MILVPAPRDLRVPLPSTTLSTKGMEALFEGCLLLKLRTADRLSPFSAVETAGQLISKHFFTLHKTPHKIHKAIKTQMHEMVLEII